MTSSATPAVRVLRQSAIAPLAAILLLASCAEAPPADVSQRTNVLVVTIDTLRADHCSVYGYERRTTPGLERIAAEGALFRSVYAPTAVTGPTHSTLFTSLHPRVHGVVKNGLSLAQERPTMAELLKEDGYQTAGIVSSFVVSSRFGYGRGFERFDDDFSDSEGTFGGRNWEGFKITGAFDRRADETTDRALEWVRGRDVVRPFFLWVHYFDPHKPYVPPEPYDELFDAGEDPDPRATDDLLYDGEIAFTDREMERLLAGLADLPGGENTLLVVTADHGEGLMDHGWPGHGPLVYEEDVRVPLIMRWEGRIRPGTVMAQPMGVIDILPTILDLIDRPRSELFLQGISAIPWLTGDANEPPSRPIHLERRLYESETVTQRIASSSKERTSMNIKGEKFGIRIGPWKYIEALEEGTRELYDLDQDPRERRNVFTENVELADRFAGLIAEWSEQQIALAGDLNPEVSPEDMEKLKSLGYLP
jgi:arylsulfatase A-like enzyme